MKRMASVFEGVSQVKYEEMLREGLGKESWADVNKNIQAMDEDGASLDLTQAELPKMHNSTLQVERFNSLRDNNTPLDTEMNTL